jgi:hypothetical protein
VGTLMACALAPIGKKTAPMENRTTERLHTHKGRPIVMSLLICTNGLLLRKKHGAMVIMFA